MDNSLSRLGRSRQVLTHPFPALAGILPALRRPLGVRDRLDDDTAVALTFDDGPGAEGTPAILATLTELDVRATFFLTGEQVRDHPAIAQDVADAGHAIGVHGDRHRNLLRIGPWALARDLAAAAASITEVTGVVPVLYRPPYGVLNAAALSICRERGWEPVLWTRWGRDWRARATPESVTAEVTRALTGGEILLLHDADRYSAPRSWATTLGALPAVVDAVRSRGLHFASVPVVATPPSARSR
jgi:peptidoglycan/xylan/chitin deacetylase (PgdA/CDA1 family)